MQSSQWKKILSLLLVCLCFFLLTWCQSPAFDQQKDVSLDFSEDEQAYLMAIVQWTLSSTTDALKTHSNEVLMVLWDQGKRAGIGYGSGKWVRSNIDMAKSEALADAGKLFDELAGLDSHLFVVWSWQEMNSGYIHGLYTVKISYGDQQVVYRPSYGIETNRNYKEMLTHMCSTLEGNVPNCEERDDVHISYAPTLHLATQWPFSQVREYYRGKIVHPKQEITTEYLIDTIERGLIWLWSNLSWDFTYVYNPSSGTYSQNNNMIRQLMGSRLLAEMANEDQTLLEKHQENVDYIFEHRYEEEGDEWYVRYKHKSKLWAIAMLVRTLVASPLLEQYTDELEKLTTTLVSLQNNDGSFNPRYIAPNYDYNVDYLLTFYSGEAIVALVELYERLKDERILEAALRAQDFYVQRYVEEIDQWYYPAYVPRHTISLYKLYQITGDERYAAAIFTLNDKVIDEMLHTDTSEPRDILGRFYNPVFSQYGTPHSASDGVYLEWLVYAYILADELNDEGHTRKYRDALTLAVHNIVQLQYQEDDMYFLQHPERVEGAVRFRADDNRIRTDTTQHALEGLRVLQHFLEQS